MKKKIYLFFVLNFLYIFLLISIYLFHINFFNVNVIFYDSLIDVAIAISLFMFFLNIKIFDSSFSCFEKVLLVIVFGLVGYCLAISIPTVIDRSLSFYMLEKLAQRGNKLPLSSFEKIFREEYIKEYMLIDVRLTEQLESGTIVINNNCVLLTSKGEKIANFSSFFRNKFLAKKRLVAGRYTSKLTNPIQHLETLPDYNCN
jgi:hypothetical protein